MIELSHVSKTYESGVKAHAIKDLSLRIDNGEFVFIVGNSGAGKSTLMKLLLKELSPTEGSIVVAGKDLNKMRHRDIPEYRRKIGCVFQDYRLLRDRNVYENVAFAMRVTEASKKQIKRRVPQMLSRVGLASKYRSLPAHLSGGEQQRVAIARALVNHPKILLADEPTGNLDGHNTWEIMKLLDEINQDGTTVVVVTHDMEIVKAMNKRVITIYKGSIVSDEEGTP